MATISSKLGRSSSAVSLLLSSSNTKSKPSSGGHMKKMKSFNIPAGAGSSACGGRRGTNSSSSCDPLTEKRLEAHDRRQEALLLARSNNKNNNNNNNNNNNRYCSPYYKAGYADSSLIRASASPGRESQATSASLPSFIVRMREWSSCFSFSFKKSNNNNKNHNNNDNNGRISNNKNKLITEDPEASAPDAAASVDIPVIKLRHSISSSRSSSHSSARMITSDVKQRRKDLSSSNDNASRVANTCQKPLREKSSPTVSTELPQTSEGEGGFDENKDRTSSVDADDSTGKEFVWANKHRPKKLDDFLCNKDKATQLRTLMRDIDCNHFIFEGPPGVGKRTMIWAMLEEAFGPDSVQVREEWKVFKLKEEANGSLKVRVRVSSQHVEINLSDVKGYEKHVIVDLIKETHNRVSKRTPQSKQDSCRAIILYDAEKISGDGLHYMKWLLQRYKGFIKFFFCCSDASKLEPIMSLCKHVQLLPPSKQEIVQVLEFIAQQEGIKLPHELAGKIADNARNNLRQAIRSFEASWHRSYSFIEDQAIVTGWEDDIGDIAKKMVQEQSPKQLYIIRGKLLNFIEHDVSPDFVLESLIGELKKHVDEPIQSRIEGLYTNYNINDANMLDGENQLVILRSRIEEADNMLNEPARKKAPHFMGIEEFIAKFMSFYKLSATSTNSRQNCSGC